MIKRRHLCVCGLTAAAKTTHGLLLAQQLGMDYVSASAVMFNVMGYSDTGANTAWSRDMRIIERQRDHDDVDNRVNDRLIELVEDSAPTVFDSWAMPYLAKLHAVVADNVLFVYFQSDVTARAVRCIVSQGPSPELNMAQTIDLIREKDAATRDRFRLMFGFDLLDEASDGKGYDVVIDLTQYVYGTSPQQAVRGIDEAHATVSATLRPFVDVLSKH